MIMAFKDQFEEMNLTNMVWRSPKLNPRLDKVWLCFGYLVRNGG